MNIVLEEVAPKKWAVNVVPTTDEDVAAGIPSGAQVALILLAVAEDLLGKHLEAEGEAEGVIEIPRPGQFPV